MANIIKTVMTYPLNGSTRDFNIPFEYLARKFIQVTLIGRDRKPLSNIDDYRFTSKNQITTNKAWGAGDGYELIELRRFTSATERLVDFSDGSILRAYDLNVSQIQTLHVAEEARDLTADTIGVNNEGHLDARGRRIVNLADPVNELDAVNLKTIKEWNNGAYQSFLKAQEEANKAARSAAAAKVSETNAHSSMTQAGVSEQRSKASETSAENSKNAAAASAQSASQSAGSASNSAQEATGAKEYTKQQADRSYNEAERAKGYADSMGNTIDIGKVIDTLDVSTGSVKWRGAHSFNGQMVVRGKTNENSTSGIFITNDGLRSYLRQAIVNSGVYELTLPKANGTIATQEWTNTMVKDLGNGVGMASPRGYTEIANNDDGNMGFWDKNTRRWVFVVGAQSGANFTGGYVRVKNANSGGDQSSFEATSPDGSKKIGLWAYNDGRAILSAYAGGSWSNITVGGVGSGTLATREWSNLQYVHKSPSYRRIWTGKFAQGDTITLSESIIGKVIAVKAYDRNRWETIHVLWAGSWATGAGNSVNMFTVSSNGRTLTSNYEAEYGYWTEIYVIE